MKQIEITKELNVEGVVDILSLDTNCQFEYKKEKDGIRCMGPFEMKGRYSTVNEVKEFKDVFTFDIFASIEKLDGDEFSLVYTGYDYSVKNGCSLILYFDVYGIYGEEENEELEETILLDEDFMLEEMEELFDEKDHVVTSYSFVVVKRMDTYESIAQRYNVDEKELMEVNMNKELKEKDLIVLPYRNPIKTN